MKILALEFSSPQRSVAVVETNPPTDPATLSEIVDGEGRITNALPLVEQSLREAGVEREQIDCLVVGIGPGSYTGIRSAIALAQGWQLAREIKLLAISSAECIAEQAWLLGLRGRTHIVIDGQRNEFYVATYEVGETLVQNIAPLALATHAEVRTRLLGSDSIVGPEVKRWFPGGQIVFPPDYLAEVYRYVRAAEGVCIADEVQVGFGRLGTHFWGFETQGVVPDIVVFGKPIGNAFPLAAVVTSPQIARSFDNGMEFFSTFGGNPVSCAVGLAVLDVLHEEGLQANALRLGQLLIREFHGLQRRYPLIGDVRGSGLFLGLDLVRSQTTREPAPDHASYIVNRLREEGVLAGTDGPHHNVVKLRPPLIFSESDATYFCETLNRILQEDPAQPDAVRAAIT